MDGLLLSPAPEPQNPITDPQNTRAIQQPWHLGEEFKDETTKEEMKPSALVNKKLKAKKKEILMNNDEASTSSPSSSTSNLNSTRRVWRVSRRLRNPMVRLDNLDKSKLEMGVSIAELRARRSKTELEDQIKAYLDTLYMSWLVVSVMNTLASTSYGAYVFSQQRIMEGNSICKAFEEEIYSWWVLKQVPPIHAEAVILFCRNQVWVQIYLAVLMILVVTYLIIHCSLGTKQKMPVTFYLLFLGMFCGLSGKLCVDTLGGNGKLWLFLWAMFCLLQCVAVRFITWAFIGLLYARTKSSTLFLYWARRSFYYGLMLALPLINGLLPFATFGEWRHHFSIFT